MLVNFYFESGEKEDLRSKAREIQAKAASLDQVQEADAKPQQLRFGVTEALAAIAVTVALVKGSREAIDELRALIASIKKLAEEVKGIRRVFVDVGKERVALDGLEERHLRILAEQKP